MPIGDNLPTQSERSFLNLFEPPPQLIEPAVRACRLFNTALDIVFYDVATLAAQLAEKDASVRAREEKPPSRIVQLDALSDPEGSLLLIDANTAPYVHRYTNVEVFLTSPHPETRAVEIVTITGVGSSALGSAALAWDISIALGKPVLAIVPGYGMADVILQALGGWFGFGLYDYLHAKSLIQNALANAAPRTASIGRQLPASTPDAKTLHGAPVFRHGSGSSDVLHALLLHRDAAFKLLVGHSKGALQIGNAIRSLPPDRSHELRVVTLGCPISTDVEGVSYYQYLGLFDALGQLNMWGHRPNQWPPTWHSTNPKLPPAMTAGKYAADAFPA
ncbi:hypothetical protein I6F33_34470 [Bradyrhizobium sp. BRP20]|uniref:hypothetical protein n=1 Tax=unclassified Bradyrhizobium TaxID=2631580 RepID=UPI001CD5145F|nr:MULTISPECIES: hypothetical protein [unclassified Bradyrhizobium]MCA1438022.1 hypothetical protein [Bradyrhizobium sp. BRP20]MCA1552102.1 hypothetical protein [Bradyrhizobium sp. BRP19]